MSVCVCCCIHHIVGTIIHISQAGTFSGGEEISSLTGCLSVETWFKLRTLREDKGLTEIEAQACVCMCSHFAKLPKSRADCKYLCCSMVISSWTSVI